MRCETGHRRQGKIVNRSLRQELARHKAKVAAEHGAVGCLIYSDRATTDIFKAMLSKGPMRPPDGVQRGSVMDMPLYVGIHCRRVGHRAGSSAFRYRSEVADTIPVMPISYADATPLLQNLAAGCAGSLARGVGITITLDRVRHRALQIGFRQLHASVA